VVSSPHELPATSVHSDPSALVAATDYAAHSEQGSELSAVGSDTSFPTRGWTSAAGSVHDEAVLAMNERTRNCYLCLRPGQFLMECPLLGSDAKHAAQRQREASSGNHLPPLRHPPGPSRRAVSSTGRPESHPRSIQPFGRSRSPHRASISSPGDHRNVWARAAGGKRDGECVETRSTPSVMTPGKQDSLI
jgi:hypothetical protein